MGHDNHSSSNSADAQKEKALMKEMMPFFFHIIWPVLIIAVIAKIFAPSTF